MVSENNSENDNNRSNKNNYDNDDENNDRNEIRNKNKTVTGKSHYDFALVRENEERQLRRGENKDNSISVRSSLTE